ncbi:hypothetical protein, partial [Bacillus anthracis]
RYSCGKKRFHPKKLTNSVDNEESSVELLSEFYKLSSEVIEENERLHQYEAFRYDYLQLVEKYMNTVEDLQKVREENKELNKLSKKQEKELKVLDRRYKSLSNSKLGRLTLWYWSFKKKKNKVGK